MDKSLHENHNYLIHDILIKIYTLLLLLKKKHTFRSVDFFTSYLTHPS